MIRVALPKGRLGERVYDRFEQAGWGCPAIREDNRKLIFENPERGISYFWAKPSDVGVYVQHGAADLGVCGSDILDEQTPEVFELLDLGLGVCRMCVAAPKGFEMPRGRALRVATKFPRTARDYYSRRSVDIDIIELHGSIELAPVVGLSDVIVDIVESGRTLRENGLEPIETVSAVSARLIANTVSYKFKYDSITAVKAALEETGK
ncbi:MAG: ATP phosphoribosyltransferase [Oscillospiraceae bacterium]|nr:ATP phosphoribosyltransferase [Oscillospiraceae bacterium]